MHELKQTKTYRALSVGDKEKIMSRLGVENIKTAFRQLRQTECFAYVDRPIWYARLTDDQKQQVNVWYEKWLNVTDTFEIPERPYFVR